MNILILEDCPERRKSFSFRFADHNIVFTEDTKEAIKLLAEQKWDALFLDHDLGGNVYVPSGPGTGYEVAKWLEENQNRMPMVVYIHTLNPSGQEKMKAALPNAIVAPFAWLSE